MLYVSVVVEAVVPSVDAGMLFVEYVVVGVTEFVVFVVPSEFVGLLVDIVFDGVVPLAEFVLSVVTDVLYEVVVGDE
ncbi:hypothetical protein GCM10028774_22180 [Spirosoma jeollabukense]